MNRIEITQNQIDGLLTSSDWSIEELTIDAIKSIPKVTRPNDLLGGFISGSMSEPKILNHHESVAGIDILCHEPNPFTKKGEGDINAYHYIIRESGHPDFPFLLIGPFRTEILIGHWPQSLDLSCYIK